MSHAFVICLLKRFLFEKQDTFLLTMSAYETGVSASRMEVQKQEFKNSEFAPGSHVKLLFHLGKIRVCLLLQMSTYHIK